MDTEQKRERGNANTHPSSDPDPDTDRDGIRGRESDAVDWGETDPEADADADASDVAYVSLAARTGSDAVEGALEEEDEASKYPLEHTWVWWFDKGAGKGVKTRDWKANLIELGEFSTVFGFWKYWRSLCDSMLFPVNSNLRLFKQGISPTWEDPANKEGGQWVVWVPPEHTASVWNEIILAVIGEQLEFSDYFTGAVLAIRPDNNRIALWNRRGLDPDAVAIVQGQLQMLVCELDKSIVVEHKLNKVAVDFNKNFRQRRGRKKNQKGQGREHDAGGGGHSSAGVNAVSTNAVSGVSGHGSVAESLAQAQVPAQTEVRAQVQVQAPAHPEASAGVVVAPERVDLRVGSAAQIAEKMPSVGVGASVDDHSISTVEQGELEDELVAVSPAPPSCLPPSPSPSSSSSTATGSESESESVGEGVEGSVSSFSFLLNNSVLILSGVAVVIVAVVASLLIE